MSTAARLKAMGIDHFHYMAPLGNVRLIAVTGILSYNQVQRTTRNPEYNEVMKAVGVKSIADPHVQFRRANRWIGNKSLHDYVPLYFGVHTPMQYVVTRDDIDNQHTTIVFIEIDIDTVFKRDGTVYTDGNAASSSTVFFDDEAGVDQIDWGIVYDTPNCYSAEYKRKKCAEVLVPDSVGPECIKRFVFLTDSVRKQFKDWLDICKKNKWVTRIPRIECDPSHFYKAANGSLIPNSRYPHPHIITC